ncbi:MAG: hypothetical protein ACUVQO_10345 [Leptodesmis sp.]
MTLLIFGEQRTCRTPFMPSQSVVQGKDVFSNAERVTALKRSHSE